MLFHGEDPIEARREIWAEMIQTVLALVVAVACPSILFDRAIFRGCWQPGGWCLYHLLRLLPELRQERLTVAVIVAAIVRYELRSLAFKLTMCHLCLTPVRKVGRVD
jgi:hypothetical protein